MIRVDVTRVNARSSARQPRSVVVKVPGPQGSAGTANIGTVTVLNPDQNPTITASGTEVDRVYNYGLPRAATVTVGTVTPGTSGNDAAVSSTVTDGDVALDFTVPSTQVSVDTVTTVNPDQSPAASSATDANGDTVLSFDLPRAPAVTVGTVTPLDPDANPSVSAVTTNGDVALDFDLPTAAQFSVDPANVLNPDQNPAVAMSEEYGDYALTFDLPRAPDFTVGTVTAVDQGFEAVTDVGTNGDIVLNFDVPKGDKGDKGDTGDTGLGVPDPIGSEGQVVTVSSGVAVWQDPVASVSALTDVDEGSGFEDGNVLIYDAAGTVWVPGEPAAGAKGGGDDKVFWENDTTVDTSYTITAGQNAGTFGPVTIQSGVTVTVPSGSEWTVL